MPRLNCYFQTRSCAEKKQQNHRFQKHFCLFFSACRRYNEKDKEILEQLLELVSEEGCCYAQDNFMRGYCLGALMTIEIFSEQNSFF